MLETLSLTRFQVNPRETDTGIFVSQARMGAANWAGCGEKVCRGLRLVERERWSQRELLELMFSCRADAGLMHKPRRFLFQKTRASHIAPPSSLHIPSTCFFSNTPFPVSPPYPRPFMMRLYPAAHVPSPGHRPSPRHLKRIRAMLLR